ncbi:uncharacterized protein RAG0_04341 [Rhynchosporium agropyri]|uniref:Uncharacterized protein n=2 Tax=Rhynchosporium TaxID=38037 RepID=A0A1E1M150_RHYSE|nr:uncharacterized protein RAG0_04341 [Rhynchosporium agropyri]CZT42839.1 uncharacterized protein RSE6_02790 [Rhynchosporium secalis]
MSFFEEYGFHDLMTLVADGAGKRLLKSTGSSAELDKVKHILETIYFDFGPTSEVESTIFSWMPGPQDHTNPNLSLRSLLRVAHTLPTYDGPWLNRSIGLRF